MGLQFGVTIRGYILRSLGLQIWDFERREAGGVEKYHKNGIRPKKRLISVRQMTLFFAVVLPNSPQINAFRLNTCLLEEGYGREGYRWVATERSIWTDAEMLPLHYKSRVDSESSLGAVFEDSAETFFSRSSCAMRSLSFPISSACCIILASFRCRKGSNCSKKSLIVASLVRTFGGSSGCVFDCKGKPAPVNSHSALISYVVTILDKKSAFGCTPLT